MIFFEITVQRPVGDEPYYLMKNTLIITLLYNKSRKTFFFLYRVSHIRVISEIFVDATQNTNDTGPLIRYFI
jgi:hypothetical protein